VEVLLIYILSDAAWFGFKVHRCLVERLCGWIITIDDTYSYCNLIFTSSYLHLIVDVRSDSKKKRRKGCHPKKILNGFDIGVEE